jgi:hypothetical protein
MKIREACRNRMPLDGTDAHALEHALTMTERERDELWKAALDARNVLAMADRSRAWQQERERCIDRLAAAMDKCKEVSAT